MTKDEIELLMNCATFISANSEMSTEKTNILKEIKQTLIPYQKDKWIIPEDIKRIEYTILSFYNVSKKDKDYNSKKGTYSEIRKFIWYFTRKIENDIGKPKYQVAYVGRLYGGRSYQTVVLGINTVLDWLESDKKFKERFELIKKRLSDYG